MTDQLEQIIKDEITKLPKENQVAINSLNWVKITEEIGNKFTLREEEVDKLVTETLLVLIGLEEPEYYTHNIEENVITTKEEAGKIAEEVAQKVLNPINDKLIEGIKRNVVNKNTGWIQNIDFILSGGNYSSFIVETRRIEVETEKEKPKIIKIPTVKKTPITPAPLNATPTLADIKASTGRTEIPIKPTGTGN